MKGLVPTVFLFAGLLHTQAAAESLAPLPPITLRAPAKIKWETSIERPAKPEQPPTTDSAETKDASPPEIVKEVTEKDGEYYRVIRSFSDNTESEIWALPIIQFAKLPKSSEPVRLLPGDSAAADFSVCDFPELAWAVGLRPSLVKSKTGESYLLVEVEAKNRPLTRREKRDLEEMRRLAKENGETPEEMEGNPFSSDQEGSLKLFLDPKTQLPLRLEQSGATRAYRFYTSTSGLQNSLRTAFNGAIRKWLEAYKEASRRPSPP